MNRLYAIPVAAASAVIMALVLSYGDGLDPTSANSGSVTPADPNDLIKLVDANNQFAMDFYSVASSDTPSENIFFSPWSIFTAFAIMFEGADGKAYDELQEVFGFIDDDMQRRATFRSINDNLDRSDTEYKLAVANALWIQQGIPIHSQYVNIAEAYYDSTVDTVDLGSNEGIDRINRWADENTNGKIKTIIPSPIPSAILAITNAIYFKGTWALQFEEEDTHDRYFQLNSDTGVITPMMSIVNSFNYTRTDNAKIIELPYKGDDISMLILLPNDIDGMTLLENSLTPDLLNTWREQRYLIKDTSVIIPKFTLETNYDLIPLLKSLGLVRPFLEEFNFPKIYDQQPTLIASAGHKAFVDVNEEGTEAAAVTGVGMFATSVQPGFIADRPFIFIIQNTQTGQILFMGKMTDPTQ